ncbi:MAG: hypothetical protein O2782_19510 [bacterium]|nr:hypothetical protein [bacterium]
MTFFLPAAADIGRLRKEGIHVHSAATCPSLPAPHLDNRKRVIVEAVAAIRGGDNPRLVGHKLLCVQRVDFYATIEAVDKTVTALQARLQEPRASSWDLDALATWLTGLAEAARRKGLQQMGAMALPEVEQRGAGLRKTTPHAFVSE